jgi:hypothetical protein
VWTLKIFTSRSDPEATNDKSGEHATEITPSSHPENVFIHLFSVISHTLTVLSKDPDMTSFPVDDQQTLLTKYE